MEDLPAVFASAIAFHGNSSPLKQHFSFAVIARQGLFVFLALGIKQEALGMKHERQSQRGALGRTGGARQSGLRPGVVYFRAMAVMQQ